jgi:hypothetical protein
MYPEIPFSPAENVVSRKETQKLAFSGKGGRQFSSILKTLPAEETGIRVFVGSYRFTSSNYNRSSIGTGSPVQNRRELSVVAEEGKPQVDSLRRQCAGPHAPSGFDGPALQHRYGVA